MDYKGHRLQAHSSENQLGHEDHDHLSLGPDLEGPSLVACDRLSPFHDGQSSLRAGHSHPSIHARSSVSAADMIRLVTTA